MEVNRKHAVVYFISIKILQSARGLAPTTAIIHVLNAHTTNMLHAVIKASESSGL